MKWIVRFHLFFLFTTLSAQQQQVRLIYSDQNLTEKGVGIDDDLHIMVDDTGTPWLNKQWKVNGRVSAQSLKVNRTQYEPVTTAQLGAINIATVPNEPQFVLSATKARDQWYAMVKMTPYVRINGQINRITSVTFDYAFAKAQVPTNRQPIANSVLASGAIYKFYVDKTGVFKITRSFLQSLGMSVNDINPATLKIFGNGGAPLPLVNNQNDNFDLRENAIQVVDGADGSFDANDYILFYGEGTRGYLPELDTNINPYAERSYYFITASGGNGQRVQNLVEPSGAPQTTITTFDDYQFHEEDVESIAKVGRRWFGEEFSLENEQTFTFNFPNIDGSQTSNLRVLTAAASESNTTFDIAVNGSLVGTNSQGTISSTTLARGDTFEDEIVLTNPEVSVTLTFNNGGNPSSRGYLDFISIEASRQLTGTDSQIQFKKNSVATQTGIGEYLLTNANDYEAIWDVTNPEQIGVKSKEEGASELRVKANLGELRTYVALHAADFYTPLKENGNTQIANQNLKGTLFTEGGGFQDIDYLMITGDLLKAQAERLAQHNRTYRGLSVKVVTLNQIYNEFGSGKPDIGAIRNLVKYVYDNASSEANRLQYLGLFGDTSVDYKDRLVGNNNIVPTFHTYQSFSLVSSYMSDDFYGSLDPEEGGMASSDKLDIAVGRILADTPQLATTVVDKIIQYDSRESYGRWRNNFVLISDDVDVSWEFTDLEQNLDQLGDQIGEEKPFINVVKIHSDAFQQQSSAGGDRYPQVNDAISNAIEVGSLVVTYLGHGGEELLASEAIITQNDVLDLVNNERLPLVVTVTCEFTKFDNPLRPSGGEQLIWNAQGGAVAAVATTREINVQLGVDFNDVFAGKLFSFGSTVVKSVAENVREAKNDLGNGLRRVIFFLGDPAQKLAFAKPNIEVTAINDIPAGQPFPQLRALDRVKINGQVTTESGQVISDYSGTLAVTLFDKNIQRQTLGNDGTTGSDGQLLILDFETLGAILYRGQASVVNGAFEFEFVMPQDTQIPVGSGRLNFYAERDGILEDQAGVNTTIQIGGLNENAPEDNTGPKISLYMNDTNFVNGGITDDSPFILALLEDENGINTASGIGHDMIAILDGDETNPIIMNDFYESEVDNFMKGTARRKLRDLEVGLHTLTFKAWDVYNNSATADLQFVVVGDDDIELENVLNYPNPFVNYTEFWFNHNRPFEPLDVQVQIFTVSGKVVKTINQSVMTDGFLSRSITWDGLDDFGQAIGKGVYVYKITVKSTLTNKTVEKFEKLVIL